MCRQFEKSSRFEIIFFWERMPNSGGTTYNRYFFPGVRTKGARGLYHWLCSVIRRLMTHNKFVILLETLFVIVILFTSKKKKRRLGKKKEKTKNEPELRKK